ncbi:MAG: hypothetical protein CSA76_03760 [Spirochaetales bacterium]|nr:MAG: hypothetical protein CSA76_03760 [Spirochaetales bacterium]
MSGEQTKKQEKAALFMQRLWDNPALAGLSPLQKETQLRQFLEMNAPALYPTLSSAAFFPGQSWKDIMFLLLADLSLRTSSALEVLSRTVLEKHVQFSFVQHFVHKTASPAAVVKQMDEFLKIIAEKPASRREMGGPLLGVGTGLVDRYMEKIYERQKYINFELRKVQRLKVSTNEITDLVKATILIRPVVRYYSGDGGILVSPAFAAKVVKEAARLLNYMPEAIVKAGVNSSLSFQENPYVESTARLAAVFSQRCQTLKHGMKVDRGAESSDKSWFSVARKNYKYYGFDLDLLVELHGIASENGW